jgi:hemoglobin
MGRTMFERYGGFAKLSKVVLAFYERMIESDVTGPYFEGVDMRRLIDHQTQFLSQVMGGPAVFTDSQLEKYHAHLRIRPAAFDESMELLRETLEDFEFAPQDVEILLGEMGRRRSCIVSAAGSPPAAADTPATGGPAAAGLEERP